MMNEKNSERIAMEKEINNEASIAMNIQKTAPALAAEHYKHATEMCKALTKLYPGEYEMVLSRLYSDLGSAEFICGQISDAERAYENALSLLIEMIDDGTDYISALDEATPVFKEFCMFGNEDKRSEVYLQLNKLNQRLYKRESVCRSIVETYRMLGKVKGRLGLIEEARCQFEFALLYCVLLNREGDKELVIETLNDFACFEISDNKLSRAETLLDDAVEHLKNSNFIVPTFGAEIFENAIRLAESIGNSEKEMQLKLQAKAYINGVVFEEP